ncbi:Shedu anti-phage system protein SduA domain-containing protein [Pseudomonas sp. DR208]|uniref:Shedu anti-phage system protein SduA domain-containing protein n=1 Tax=Pseudomonas sp. DR208 TaxID=2870840 RepID=UPI001C995B2C|nr:Shedu anti-phage system protein SduA domain-containing protein [Pseudomonas sp. DR208]QZP22867.1 DUF4263 domain-containing protein [Pseudomonas sp. DR208]
MKFDIFKSITIDILRKYLSGIWLAHNDGRLDSGEGVLSYPTAVLFANCDGYFVAELIGHSSRYNGLDVIKVKTQNIYRYLSQYHDDASDAFFELDAAGHGFKDICFGSALEIEGFEKRFPSIRLFKTFIKGRAGGESSSFLFGDNFRSLHIEECLFVNKREEMYRCKHVKCMFVLKSDVSVPELKAFYSDFLSGENVRCATTGKADSRVKNIAAQLQGLYLSKGVHETTIGKFINDHPEVIHKAFRCKSFLHEKSFKWLESKFEIVEKEIRPDLLVLRDDGFYDIYDLKTAVDAKKSLTNTKSSRRKFIDCVSDGVAQLINYREYFKYEKNAKYALENHGVRVSDPELVLVVGSMDNFSALEVEQAAMMYQKVTIIDYDTLCFMYSSSFEK